MKFEYIIKLPYSWEQTDVMSNQQQLRAIGRALVTGTFDRKYPDDRPNLLCRSRDIIKGFVIFLKYRRV